MQIRNCKSEFLIAGIRKKRFGMVEEMNKNELRKEMSVKRDNLTRQQIYEKSKCIFNNLINSELLTNVYKVFSFVSYKSECDTSFIIDYCLKKHMGLSVPRVNNDEMDFYSITGLQELKKGSYGILEPIGNNKTFPVSSDVIIMPGLVFDSEGNRIGYGGGYYDRYISRYKEGLHIAICFDCQVIDNDIIEINVNDITPDIIVTDKRIIDLR